MKPLIWTGCLFIFLCVWVKAPISASSIFLYFLFTLIVAYTLCLPFNLREKKRIEERQQEFRRQVAIREAEEQKEMEERERERQKEWDALVKKFGQEEAEKISRHTVWGGASFEAVVLAWGEPEKTETRGHYVTLKYDLRTYKYMSWVRIDKRFNEVVSFSRPTRRLRC